MSAVDIKLRFQPSAAFLRLLAELNERAADGAAGGHDAVAWSVDARHGAALFDPSLFATPLSRQIVTDLVQVATALMTGDYPLVRRYTQALRFAFVIGYPHSGGRYLTSELLRTLGLDPASMCTALAGDGFPELRDLWYDWNGDRPRFHLQDAIFQTAEFLVIAKHYYQRNTVRHPHGYWLAPKQLQQLVNWGGSFKMLLGEGRADYLVTVRHPLPTAVAIFEESGGLPADRLFPARQPRSAMERWILADLKTLGYAIDQVASMDYCHAVQVSWSQFYARMATSGLFLGVREELRAIAYGSAALESVVREYRARHLNATAPAPLLIQDQAGHYPDWQAHAATAVEAMTALWASLGLTFPALTLA